MDADQFDTLVAGADPAMIVVTAATSEGRSGCLVGFHSQVSIDPLQYGVWISKANRTHRFVVTADHLGIHHLADSDIELARLFGTATGDDVDKFARCEVTVGAHGVPLLGGCGRWMIGRRVAVLDGGGDHSCVVVEPVGVSAPAAFVPLRFRDVEDLEAGHAADEDRS